MIAQHLHNLFSLSFLFFFFFFAATEKPVCVPFQGQETYPQQRVAKIDTEHKLSAPLKDLGGTYVQMGLCF